MTMLQSPPRSRKAGRIFGEGLHLDDSAGTVVPKSARWIRIVGGSSAGEYEAVADPHGRREWRLIGGDLRRDPAAVDRLFEVGRIAILSTPPKAPERPAKAPVWSNRDIRPEPRVEPARPTLADAFWWSGHTLASAGIEARPCSSWPEDLQEAFRAGAAEGLEAFDHDMAIESERWLDQERACGRGHMQEEWAEVGCRAPY